MIRYFPPKETEGLLRSRVNGKSLSPRPPANTIPSILGLFKVASEALKGIDLFEMRAHGGKFFSSIRYRLEGSEVVQATPNVADFF